MKSKIISDLKNFYFDTDQTSNADGYVYTSGNCVGQGRGNGIVLSRGTSVGDGYTSLRMREDREETRLIDPIHLTPVLEFFSLAINYWVSWDTVWTECNDEQKQHLLLFLPLRVSND